MVTGMGMGMCGYPRGPGCNVPCPVMETGFMPHGLAEGPSAMNAGKWQMPHPPILQEAKQSGGLRLETENENSILLRHGFGGGLMSVIM